MLDTNLERLEVFALQSFLLLSRNPGEFVYLCTIYFFNTSNNQVPFRSLPRRGRTLRDGLNAGQNSSGSCLSGWVGKKTSDKTFVFQDSFPPPQCPRQLFIRFPREGFLRIFRQP